MRFNGKLRGKKSVPMDTWIDDAIDSELIPIMRFARVLRRDIDAVNNAIELPWSNGQAEGQINRLKTLKRAMYGRAARELVRARTLPPRPCQRAVGRKLAFTRHRCDRLAKARKTVRHARD